jgi:hypothetical protein
MSRLVLVSNLSCAIASVLAAAAHGNLLYEASSIRRARAEKHGFLRMEGFVVATGALVRRVKIVSQNAIFVNHSLTKRILFGDNHLDLIPKTIKFHKY